MKFKIGKVIKYDGQLGEIMSCDNIYKFLKKDIESQINIKTNDYVLFRGEFINGIYRAHFVQHVSKSLDNPNFKKICNEIIMGK